MVLRVFFRSNVVAPKVASDDGNSSRSHVWIQDDATGVSSAHYDASNKVLWELTRMYCLLFMIVLNVSEGPYIAGILAVGVTRQFASVFATIALLFRILLRDSHGIQMEHVLV